jgi:hypothetical protein
MQDVKISCEMRQWIKTNFTPSQMQKSEIKQPDAFHSSKVTISSIQLRAMQWGNFYSAALLFETWVFIAARAVAHLSLSRSTHDNVYGASE